MRRNVQADIMKSGFSLGLGEEDDGHGSCRHSPSSLEAPRKSFNFEPSDSGFEAFRDCFGVPVAVVSQTDFLGS